jgi:hypothetical protein
MQWPNIQAERRRLVRILLSVEQTCFNVREEIIWIWHFCRKRVAMEVEAKADNDKRIISNSVQNFTAISLKIVLSDLGAQRIACPKLTSADEITMSGGGGFRKPESVGLASASPAAF